MIVLGGMKCVCCGEDDYRILTFDHKEGLDGHVITRKPNGSRTGFKSSDYYRIIRGEEKNTNLRITCWNCNILNEFRRGRRFMLPETVAFVLANGGKIPGG